MTADDSLAIRTAEFREAVTGGRYADAELLLPAYTHAVAQLQNAEAAAEAGDLVEWARKLVLARKAEIGARIASLPPNHCAYASSARPAHTWELEG